MGEFSLTHIVILLVIVLIFFGPSKLPGLGKALGESIRGFKKGISDETPKDTSIDPNRQLNGDSQSAAPKGVKKDEKINS